MVVHGGTIPLPGSVLSFTICSNSSAEQRQGGGGRFKGTAARNGFHTN
jgi:hypothetical protein